MQSIENQHGENFVTNVVRWVCFAGLLVVLAFGILFGSFAINQSQTLSQDASNKNNTPVYPQGSESRKIEIQAGKAFDEGDFEESARLYSILFENNPKDYTSLFRKGLSLQSLGKLDEALAVYKKTRGKRFLKSKTFYNMAVIYGMKKDKSRTLSHLQKAVQEDFISPKVLMSEEVHFAFLKDNSEFLKYEQLALPLKRRTIYRQFDFILGSWQRYDKDDAKLETKLFVKKENNGYQLTIVMTGRQGSRTTGIYYVDPEDMKWKHIWVLIRGGVLKYEGEFRNGVMTFSGKSIDSDGDDTRIRKIYTPIGQNKIEQLSEISQDGGKTWTNGFESYWLRIDEDPTQK